MTLPARLEQIRRRALAELEHAPRERSWQVEVSSLIALEVSTGLTASLLLAPNNLQHRGPTWHHGLAIAVGVIALCAALSAIRPGGRVLRVGLLTLFIPLLAALLAAASGLGTRTGVVDELRCATLLGVTAGFPAVATAVLMARFAPSRTRAVLGGAAAGAPGMVALHLHCPIGLEVHVAAGHLVPWVGVTLLVVWLRSRLTTQSYAP
ncbi:MAG: hypothetical protein U0228_37590 [Myxococcaceae bacterium]